MVMISLCFMDSIHFMDRTYIKPKHYYEIDSDYIEIDRFYVTEYVLDGSLVFWF